jgi:hypothetical protein
VHGPARPSFDIIKGIEDHIDRCWEELGLYAEDRVAHQSVSFELPAEKVF